MSWHFTAFSLRKNTGFIFWFAPILLGQLLMKVVTGIDGIWNNESWRALNWKWKAVFCRKNVGISVCERAKIGAFLPWLNNWINMGIQNQQVILCWKFPYCAPTLDILSRRRITQVYSYPSILFWNVNGGEQRQWIKVFLFFLMLLGILKRLMMFYLNFQEFIKCNLIVGNVFEFLNIGNSETDASVLKHISHLH